jgi:hypothetical protein
VPKQLECRIVITRGKRADFKTEVGMYDPYNDQYEPLGAHGPDRREVERVIANLKSRMEQAGHRVSFCERS